MSQKLNNKFVKLPAVSTLGTAAMTIIANVPVCA
jgi:hypothetical protein